MCILTTNTNIFFCNVSLLNIILYNRPDPIIILKNSGKTSRIFRFNKASNCNDNSVSSTDVFSQSFSNIALYVNKYIINYSRFLHYQPTAHDFGLQFPATQSTFLEIVLWYCTSHSKFDIATTWIWYNSWFWVLLQEAATANDPESIISWYGK